MKTFNLKIYASDHIFYDGECEHISVPTKTGQYGILANYRNTISAIEPGMIKFRDIDGVEHEAVVTRGMIKVEENTVLVLVLRCEYPDEVDLNAIKREEEEALRQIREKSSKKEFHNAEANLSRAMNKLKNNKNNRI